MYTAGVLTASTDYFGKVVYEDEQPAFAFFADGRAMIVPGETAYLEFHLKDHLGNVRVTLRKNAAGAPEVLQENAYYPFGLVIQDLSVSSTTTNDNKFKYNAKELQSDHGLEWYDYGARFYDPQLARWFNVDPLAEIYYSYSNYSYCVNNPILFIDPDGKTIDGDKKRVQKLKDESKKIITSEKADQLEIQSKIANRTKEGKKTSSLERRLKNSQERVTQLEQGIKDIETLENSSITYFVNSNYNSSGEDDLGNIEWDQKNGRVQLNVAMEYGLSGLLHEITHGAQFDNGYLDLAKVSNMMGLLYDINDEVEAFKRQVAFSNNCDIDIITPAYVRSLGERYMQLPAANLTTNSTMFEINSAHKGSIIGIQNSNIRYKKKWKNFVSN